MPTFSVSHYAERDLEELFNYLAEQNRDSAINFVRKMTRKFDLIAMNPKMGVTKDNVIVDLRMFPFENYNIFYFQTAFGVEIYRILHSSRDNIQVFGDTADKPH